MKRGNHLDAQPPVVIKFDHPPTDAELQVRQPFRNPTGNIRLRKDSGVWTIYQPRFPLLLMLLFSLGMFGALIAMAVQEWQDDLMRSLLPILLLMALLLVAGMWSAARSIARQGPLVAYYRNRGELQIEGRAEPLTTAEVTEIVELTLLDRGWGVGKRNDGHFALYLVVHQRDGVYTAERLYHGQPSGKATWDAAPQLAKALGVGYRRIELEHPDPVLSPFANTKPPQPLSKITRK